MQIYTGAQIKNLDVYTIEHEPIRSIDLMERAATVITDAITRRWDKSRRVVVFAGPGNNGGDALAVARLMVMREYDVEVFLFNINKSLSDDCAVNKQRLQGCDGLKKFVEVSDSFAPPLLDRNTLIIDGLFGSGLNKPLAGGFASLVKFINASSSVVASIDMPSGLMTEDNTYNNRQHIIRATVTLTLGQKKLAMYLADNETYCGEIQVLDIGLSKEYQQRYKSTYCLVEEKDVKKIIKRRSVFSHKGMMGHALIIAGSYGMAGAAVLAARAALRSGTGKLTVHTPSCNNGILQVAVPEAVVSQDSDEKMYSQLIDTDSYNAVAIGCGLGQDETTAIALMSQIPRVQSPIVLDADALNILSSHRPWINQLPRSLILTPHPGELDRLSGAASNSCFERLAKAVDMAARLHSYVVLKGHYTALCCPDGDVCLNSTGNAGMATAGAGDVLTGVITGLLARGYPQAEACLVGIYVHGLAGDIAKEAVGEESLVAGDIIKCLPQAFKQLYSQEEKQNQKQ